MALMPMARRNSLQTPIEEHPLSTTLTEGLDQDGPLLEPERLMSDTLVKRLATRLATLLMAWTVGAGVAAFTPDARAADSSAPQESAATQQAASAAKPKPDLSGRKRVGEASFYAKKFAGRKMADGTAMDPNDDNAASKTLPLGTTAKVTNLETGQSATVTIQDRGPHVKGRIVDLSPSTAQKIGITRNDGVAKVEVVPIAVPLPDGSVKAGVAARGAKSE